MARTVVLSTTPVDEVLVDDLSSTKVYAFQGTKGLFVLTQTKEGKFSFNSLEKTSKPKNVYATVKDAVTAKINAGYDVVEYDSSEELLAND